VVGAPIFNNQKRVIASCAVAALKTRIKNDKKIKELGKLVKNISSQISNELGGGY